MLSVPLDPESNMDNYDKSCMVNAQPLMQWCWRGSARGGVWHPLALVELDTWPREPPVLTILGQGLKIQV